MTWIFSSFQVTPCVLTSCHFVISKQSGSSEQSGPHRCVTRRRPGDENHAVRFGQNAENCRRVRDAQPIRCLSLQGRVQALAPSGSQKKIWEEEVLSLSISLSIYLSTNNKLWALSRIKREIYFYKKVFCLSRDLLLRSTDRLYNIFIEEF